MRDSNLRPHLMYQDSETGDGGYYPATSERNSSRVDLRSRKAPSMALVTVPDCCFSTPRIIMQKRSAFPARAGVRINPARDGSSPIFSRILCIKDAMDSSSNLGCITFTSALFFFICLTRFKPVAPRLLEPYLRKTGPLGGKLGSPMRFEPVLDHSYHVLGCRHQFGKLVHVGVQVPVSEIAQDLLFHQDIQGPKIHHLSVLR